MGTENGSGNLDSLQLHFRKSVPVTFVDRLLRRQTAVYEEAKQFCFNSGVMSEVEAKWLLGDAQRCVFENEMRLAAKEAGLQWEDAQHFGNNCSYVKVAAGNFRITSHRVASPGTFVQPCESRKQDAAVNQFLDEWIDEGLLCVPLPKIVSAPEIAAYILHGTTFSDEKAIPFLELAIPDSELQQYRWHLSFPQLKQAYLADAREIDKAGKTEDRARPQLKKKGKEEAENE